MPDLSIIIPARNEMFLARTIDDILQHMRGDTEIIAVLDGAFADPPIPDHPRVTLIYHHQAVGQRAAMNDAARLSRAKYIMKVDAHCAFDEGFDVKMMAEMHDDWTMVPTMKNLHAFDWVCPACSHRQYQGPKPTTCPACKTEQEFVMDIVWIAKKSPNSVSYRFDKDLHFQYWRDYAKRPEAQGEISETMSLQGSCFMVTRQKYWELELADEKHGSWGQQGVEVACKTWLSGGRVVVNKKTWYAHMFRTQPGFTFPYPNTNIEQARRYSRDLWLNDKWPKAKYSLQWLLDKFAPVPDWTESKGILYYTCNTHRDDIEQACRANLKKAANGKQIGCVSLKPTQFGTWYTHLDLERSPLTMHKQILLGLQKMTTDYVFLCESDVLYHPSHFDFVPPRNDVFYYNEHTYKYNILTGQIVFYYTKQVSGCCASRELLLEFYTKRVEQIEKEGFNRHYEPGIKQSVFPYVKGGKYGAARWMAKFPNVDIRHDKNITVTKRSLDDFRDPKASEGWREVVEIPGWVKTGELFALQ